jgi:HK97 gp10 family phage protein
VATARASFPVAVTLRIGALNQLPRIIKEQTRKAVDETAAEIQTRARQIAPRDTGSLSESIYVTNGTDSDYTTRTSAARGVNRRVTILEEIRPDFVISPSGGDAEYSAVIGVAAEHGEPVEFGTRYMDPQPYMTPSVEPQRDEFVTRLKKNLTSL